MVEKKKHLCKFLCKDGKPCQRKTTMKYCWQHQNKSKKSIKKKIPEYKSKKSTKKKIPEYKLYNPLQAKYCRCVSSVKAKGSAVNPWAVCSKTVGRVTNSCKQYE